MIDERCRQFFLQPGQTNQRRYEALRAYFVEGRPLAAIADQFGYRVSSLKSMVCRFRSACGQDGPPPFFCPTPAAAPPGDAAPTSGTGRNRPPSPTPGS